MNESDTRLHKIDPQLKAVGWGVTEGSRITTEYTFTKGKVSKTQKGKPKRVDYVLVYRGVKLAIVEAKSDELSYAEGVPQAKEYADMLAGSGSLWGFAHFYYPSASGFIEVFVEKMKQYGS